MSELLTSLIELLSVRKRSQYPPRNGNVTAYELKRLFGFRYVNVDVNLDEKQEQDMLNISYGTFQLLARCIHQPMLAIGLGRNLTLNIGVRQMGLLVGGCYNSVHRTLNFKKLSEYKHVAHEWFHALDHYLSYTFCDTDKDEKKLASCRDLDMDWTSGWNWDTKTSFENLNYIIALTPYYQKSLSIQKITGDEYWTRPQELAARAFEVYIDGKMRQLGEHDEHLVSMYPGNPYPDFSNEKDEPISQAFDEFFRTLDMKKTEYDIESLYGTYGASANEKTAAGQPTTVIISFRKKDVRRSPNNLFEMNTCQSSGQHNRPYVGRANQSGSNYLSGAKVRKRDEFAKKLAKKIADWDKNPISDSHTFVLGIGNLIGAEGDTESKYKICIEDNGKSYSLRISLHNANVENYRRHGNAAKNKYGVTFKPKDEPSSFKTHPQIRAVEYVYFEEYTGSERLKDIAKAILNLLETGFWDETIAPANVKNVSPKGGQTQN
jgi:hypothetical protein